MPPEAEAKETVYFSSCVLLCTRRSEASFGSLSSDLRLPDSIKIPSLHAPDTFLEDCQPRDAGVLVILVRAERLPYEHLYYRSK